MSQLSNYFVDTFSFNTSSKTDSKFIIMSHDMRISVLTSRLIRFEKGKNFTDEATQSVINRNFDTPNFSADINNDTIKIKTDDCLFTFSAKKAN